jgi:hypothetical protein
MREAIGIKKLLGIFRAPDIAAPETDVIARANPRTALSVQFVNRHAEKADRREHRRPEFFDSVTHRSVGICAVFDEQLF